MDLVIHSDDEDDTDEEYYERYPKPSHQVSGEPSNAYLGYPTLHLFKELEIAVKEVSIYSGAALRILSCPPYDGCPFPQIRKLLLYLITEDMSEYRTTISPEDRANISAFVQRIKEMAPMASSIHIVESDYPFSDDVLFKGNASSLESLDMSFCRYNIFTTTSHPKLKYVKVGVWLGTYPAIAEDLQLGLSIGIGAPVREITQSFPGFKLAPAYLSLGDCAYIRVLILLYIPLNLWDALAIIKALPLLSDLYSQLPRLGKTSGIALDDFPTCIVSVYAPMGERFQHWNFGKCDLGTKEEAAKCLLILALVCQNFSYSISPSDVRNQFKTELKDAIALVMFSYYAPRL
ncbi:hypothetical protein GGI19_002207 [Coemansia pectinata]|uniref:Uncharacterized protein n=1 Tax=Coemansia pectinata TaxID=1052879 RepID=A0A9W8LAJ2_9FUNG|nr:hypothetical protein GGI19_002207 [Coemansia pectinata]